MCLNPEMSGVCKRAFVSGASTVGMACMGVVSAGGVCQESFNGKGGGRFQLSKAFSRLVWRHLSGLVSAGGRYCRGFTSCLTLISVVVQNFSEIERSATEL